MSITADFDINQVRLNPLLINFITCVIYLRDEENEIIDFSFGNESWGK